MNGLFRPRRIRQSGFTLIELIVVIVLMAILAAVAAPRFFGRDAFEGPAFAQELASAARYAQKLAITSGCPVRFTVAATYYEIKQPQTPPGAVCGTDFTMDARRPGSGEPFTGALPAGIGITGAPRTIEFRATGEPYDVATSMALGADAVFGIGGREVAISRRSGYVDLR